MRGNSSHTTNRRPVLLAIAMIAVLFLTSGTTGVARGQTIVLEDSSSVQPKELTQKELTQKELTPKELKRLERARQKTERKAERDMMRQDLTKDQQKQLDERIKDLEGMGVGQHVQVRSGVRGEAIDRDVDSLMKRAAFIRNLPDSVLADTLFLPDSVMLAEWRELPDSMVVEVLSDSILRAAVADSVLKQAPYNMFRDDVDTEFIGSGGKLTVADPQAEGFVKHKFRITQDTLKAGRVTWLSALAPGFGQIYNRQQWKLPILYGTLGGFLAGGFIYNHQFKKYDAAYQQTVDLRLPAEMQKRAQTKRREAGSGRTLLFGAAAASYLYFVSDAVFNYRGPVDPVRKATTLAAVFPGMGFVYTKTYWRLPIYYGGFIALATVIDYNNRSYKRYKKAYDLLTDGNPSTIDEFNGRYPAETLARVRSSYRRDRDFAIIATAAAYLLSVVDTYVIATLKNWDMNEDLTVRVEPVTMDLGLGSTDTGIGRGGYRRSGFVSPGMPSQAHGLTVKIRF